MMNSLPSFHTPRILPRAAGYAFLCASAVTPVGALAAGEDLTFHKDAVPILQKYCNSCHHDGGSAPQSFETYRQMRPWIRTTRKTVMDATMPPWPADPAVGKWKNMLMPTPAEVEVLSMWAKEAKGAEGEASDAPPAIDYSAEWLLGTPDKTFQAEEGFTVPAAGDDLYRAFVLGPEFTADTWVRGIELKPGEIDVVSDMALSAVPTGVARAAADAETGEGFAAFDHINAEGARSFIAVWNKGMTLTEMFPEGTGVLIPKGTSLVLQIHYRPAEEELTDRSSVGLFLHQAPPAKELKTLVIQNRDLAIPANSYQHKVEASAKLDKAVLIHAVLPRMHYLGNTLDLTASGGGAETPLLKILNYDYEMQTLFTAAEPVALAAGTTLNVSAMYENNQDNPNNPNMTITEAKYGPAPGGEILEAVIYYTEQ